MVRELISREFSVRLSDVSVGRLLHKLGLSPQRLVRRAYQQNQAIVGDWMAKDFPAIKKLAKQVGADIYFGDEASVRSDYHSGNLNISPNRCATWDNEFGIFGAWNDSCRF